MAVLLEGFFIKDLATTEAGESSSNYEWKGKWQFVTDRTAKVNFSFKVCFLFVSCFFMKMTRFMHDVVFSVCHLRCQSLLLISFHSCLPQDLCWQEEGLVPMALRQGAEEVEEEVAKRVSIQRTHSLLRRLTTAPLQLLFPPLSHLLQRSPPPPPPPPPQLLLQRHRLSQQRGM